MATLGFAVPSKKTLVLSIAPVLLSAYLIYRFSPPGIVGSPPPKRERADSSSPQRKQAGPIGDSRRGKSTDGEEEDDTKDYYDDLVSVLSDGEDNQSLYDHVEHRRTYGYYCMFRPFFDIENENADKEEDDQVDEDELIKQYNEYIRADDNIEMKPASDHPEHRWIAMWETWKLFSAWEKRASYTNPEFFKMNVSRSFHGLGMQEQIENMLLVFNKEFEKKRSKRGIREMWAIVAAIMQFLTEIPLDSWIRVNDKKKLEATIGLIGRALLTTLNELDRAKILKADSDIKDLGLVITFYLYWADEHQRLREQGIELPFRKEVIAYAKKAGVDLKIAGCYGTDAKVQALEKERGKPIKPLSGSPKSDRWDWKKKFKRFGKDYKIGGEKYNILKMSRKERASHSHDKKDPLADIPDKAIEDGTVRVRPVRPR
ncbi:uncharacterized protein GGS22DRAFT_154775 [Annulohypoxylon maeteangense]|uniref:uncharacterized protein n=1 Tax=Annulohypoxylon maeteangense TaxID=1927788 RepID=UPI002008D3FC|nr:uncharacterized protein GGS22DRAFT_154775 [Annulohypoxylon maeteangense]KAI0887999.1 hypothetical protein GGS22DRAFT_154775 [Annulohypoxylon maeteangense]